MLQSLIARLNSAEVLHRLLLLRLRSPGLPVSAWRSSRVSVLWGLLACLVGGGRSSQSLPTRARAPNRSPFTMLSLPRVMEPIMKAVINQSPTLASRTMELTSAGGHCVLPSCVPSVIAPSCCPVGLFVCNHRLGALQFIRWLCCRSMGRPATWLECAAILPCSYTSSPMRLLRAAVVEVVRGA